uniref:Putative secreted peptide n=1 Tax=Anopheles braziliensis TaxID=58242 RepID=A0A2M3ZSD7_9DIPT
MRISSDGFMFASTLFSLHTFAILIDLFPASSIKHCPVLITVTHSPTLHQKFPYPCYLTIPTPSVVLLLPQ